MQVTVKTLNFLRFVCNEFQECYVMNSKSDKPRINFPRDGQRTAVIGTDLIAEMTKTRKWPCRGTVLCFMVTEINHLYIKLTSSLLLNN